MGENGHGRKEFTGALGKDMCIRSYFMIRENIFLSNKQY